MAAVTLLGLKRRLKIVQNTRKITRAMGLVSTSKYQRTKTLLYSNDNHFKSLREIVAEVFRNVENKDSVYFNPVSRNNKKLYVIMNSNKGMVGGYNSQIINHAILEMQKDGEIPYIITTGKRGMTYLKRIVMDDFTTEEMSIPDIPSYDDLSGLFNYVLGMYFNGHVNEVKVIYTRYLSPVRTDIMSETLLPLKVENVDSMSSGKVNFEFEPSADRMQDTLIKMYIKEKIYNILLNAKTAEQSTRMRAMDSASKNADEILVSLNKQFNRLRQSVITQEISEIVGGAEALK